MCWASWIERAYDLLADMSLASTLNLFYASLAVSLPTFGWVALGVALNAFGILPQWLNDRISLLAFRFGLPLMLFAPIELLHRVWAAFVPCERIPAEELRCRCLGGIES